MLPCYQPIASDHSMYSMRCLAPHSAVPPNYVLSSHRLAGSMDHLTQLGAPSLPDEVSLPSTSSMLSSNRTEATEHPG